MCPLPQDPRRLTDALVAPGSKSLAIQMDLQRPQGRHTVPVSGSGAARPRRPPDWDYLAGGSLFHWRALVSFPGDRRRLHVSCSPVNQTRTETKSLDGPRDRLVASPVPGCDLASPDRVPLACFRMGDTEWGGTVLVPGVGTGAIGSMAMGQGGGRARVHDVVVVCGGYQPPGSASRRRQDRETPWARQ